MKRITSLVAMLAALMALGAAFAGSASAGTVLCAKEAKTCAPADVKAAGAELVTAGSPNEAINSFSIKNGSTERFGCEYNVMKVKSTAKNGNPLPGEFQGVAGPYDCVYWGQKNACTSTTFNSPPTSIEATESGGIVRIGTAGQPLTFSFTCKMPGSSQSLTCSYAATNTVTMNVVGNAATIKGAPLTSTIVHPFCSWSELKLNVTNEIGPLPSSYISKATETVLCGVEASPCPNDKVEPAGKWLWTADPYINAEGLQVTKESGNPQVFCDENNMSFKTTSSSGAPLPTAAQLLVGSCSVYGVGKCPSSSVSFNTPPSSIESAGLSKGVAHIGTASQPLVLSTVCDYGGGTVYPCKFTAPGTVDLQVNYETSTATLNKVALVRTEGHSIFCSTNVTISVSNAIATPPFVAAI